MNDHTTTHADIIPYLYYRDVPAALDWLSRVFGFSEVLRHVTPRGGMHAEMLLGGRRIMLGGKGPEGLTPAETGTATQGVFVYVNDVAAHYARALAAGAATDGPPTDHGYGLTYTVHDLDGHPWFFCAASDAMT